MIDYVFSSALKDQLKCLFVLGCSCLSLLSYAQTNTQQDSIWKNMDLGEFVVTAQYVPTSVQDADYQVKVIKAESIEKLGFNNLSEVLSQQLNLKVNLDPILGNGLKIQGIGGENIQILIDGVPVIGRLAGNIDLTQINMHNVQQIEIIQGAMSTQFGSNASGGVINIITRKNQSKPLRIMAQSQWESLNINTNTASLGFKKGKFNTAITGFYNQYTFLEQVDSFRNTEEVLLPDSTISTQKSTPWNPKVQKGLDAMFRFSPNSKTDLNYQYRVFDEVLSIYGEINRPQFKPYSFDQTYTTLRQDHQLNFEKYFNKKVYLKSTTSYNQYDRIRTTLRYEHDHDTSSIVENDLDTTRFNAFLNRNVLSLTQWDKLNIQLGSDILIESGSGKRIVDSLSLPINQSTLSNYALWTSLKYKWSKLSVNANLRAGYNTKYKHPLIPALHLKWKLSDRWDFQANLASGFRAPSLKELYFRFIDTNHYIIGNKDLLPEDSRNVSIAIRRFSRTNEQRKLELSSTLFYNKINNRIVLAAFEQARYNYQNLEQFQTHGINFEASFTTGSWWNVKTGFALNRIFNNLSADFVDSDRFTNLFETQSQLNLDLEKMAVYLTLNHRYIGQQVNFFINSAEELEQGFTGAYHLMDLSLNKKFWNNRISIGSGIKNLLDVQAVPLSGQASSNHGGSTGSQLVNWGRNSFIRLRLELN